jgi:hypothetical protein
MEKLWEDENYHVQIIENSKLDEIPENDIYEPKVIIPTDEELEIIDNVAKNQSYNDNKWFFSTLTTKIDTPLSDYIKKIQDGSVSKNMKISTKKLQHFDIFNTKNIFHRCFPDIFVNKKMDPTYEGTTKRELPNK